MTRRGDADGDSLLSLLSGAQNNKLPTVSGVLDGMFGFVACFLQLTLNLNARRFTCWWPSYLGWLSIVDNMQDWSPRPKMLR